MKRNTLLNASYEKYINLTIKAHFIRGAFYLLLLLAVCVIPFALAERNTTKPGKPSLTPVMVGISAATDSIQKYNLGTCGWQPGPDQPPARYAF